MKILIIRAGALGDTLMLLPAVTQLSDRAQVYLAGRYPGIDYLRPFVHRTYDFESSGWQKLFMDSPEINDIVSFSDIEDQTIEHIAEPETELPSYPGMDE